MRKKNNHFRAKQGIRGKRNIQKAEKESIESIK